MSDDVRWLDADEQAAWRNIISGWTVFAREIERRLLESHDLTLDDYAILVLLSEAPGRSTRMSALAANALLPRPQVTYRITRLERRGIVRREPCDDDGRGTNAVLTDEGFALLQDAAVGHVRNVRDLFLDHLDREQFLTMGVSMGQVFRALAPTEAAEAQRA